MPVSTGRNACEVLWRIDIPGLENFVFAFQNNVTNNNCYENDVTLCIKLCISLLIKRAIEEGYIHLNWSVPSADTSQHTENFFKWY